MSGGERTNPDAYYVHEKYFGQGVRFSNRHEEVRFQIAIGPRNGHIVGFRADNPGVCV